MPAEDTITYAEFSNAHYDQVVQILMNDFRVNEPLNRHLALPYNDVLDTFSTFAKITLNNKISVVALSGDLVVGCRLSSVIERNAPKQPDPFAPAPHCIAPIFALLDEMVEGMWDLMPADAEKVMKFEMVSVLQSHTRRGIAQRLIEISMERAVSIGCNYVQVIATSHKTQSLFERKLNFCTGFEVELAKFKFDGNFPFEGMPEDNRIAKFMFRKL